MHEMSLVAGILRIVDDEAGKHGFAKVKVVRLQVGALSHADPDALRFAFEASTMGTGTVTDGAALDIVRVPGQAFCFDCTETVTVQDRGEPCPNCGSYKLNVVAGDDLSLKELEVD